MSGTQKQTRWNFPPALRHATFRLYYGGLVFSSFGNNFTQLAITWQMYEMTGSALQLGLLGLSRAFTSIPVLLFGGLLADAIDRRRLMMATQAGQLGVTVMLLSLSATGQLSPGIFYVAAMLGGLFTSLENPSRQAIIPNMVPQNVLANAMALNATQRSVSQIAGPAIAGILLAFVGPTANYAVTTVSWLTMIAVLTILKPVPQTRAGLRSISMRSIGEGFSYVWNHRILLSMMLLDFSQNFLGAVRALLPIYALVILDVGPEGFGLLSAASALGTITGGVLMSMVGHIRQAGLGVLIGVAIFGVCTVLFAFNGVFWIALLLLAGQGFGDVVSHVFRGTILQLNIPDRLRGRVTSVNQVFTTGGGPLGNFRAGAMAAWLGPEIAVLAGGVSVLAIVFLIGLGVPMVRRYTLELDAVVAQDDQPADGSPPTNPRSAALPR